MAKPLKGDLKPKRPREPARDQARLGMGARRAYGPARGSPTVGMAARGSKPAVAAKPKGTSKGPTGTGTVKAVNNTTPTTTTAALLAAKNTAPATTTVKPNARVLAERKAKAAWIAKNPGKRYTRTTTAPAPRGTGSTTTRSSSSSSSSSSKGKTTGVNKATQAVRDARAVSKAAGERYTRKAGGEKSVNSRTQARRVERATVRGQNKKGPVVIPPPGTTPTVASQRGATDWQKAHADWMTNPSGIDPAFDINNTDAQYKADANVKYRDEDGSIGWRAIAQNLRAQIVAAMADGKTQVVLPDGEKWAAHQSTLDQIDKNLAGSD